jgi:hypothetical protein
MSVLLGTCAELVGTLMCEFAFAVGQNIGGAVQGLRSCSALLWPHDPAHQVVGHRASGTSSLPQHQWQVLGVEVRGLRNRTKARG